MTARERRATCYHPIAGTSRGLNVVFLWSGLRLQAITHAHTTQVINFVHVWRHKRVVVFVFVFVFAFFFFFFFFFFWGGGAEQAYHYIAMPQYCKTLCLWNKCVCGGGGIHLYSPFLVPHSPCKVTQPSIFLTISEDNKLVILRYLFCIVC